MGLKLRSERSHAIGRSFVKCFKMYYSSDNWLWSVRASTFVVQQEETVLVDAVFLDELLN